MVPTSSPDTILAKSPLLYRLNTTIGTLFSIQSVMDATAITLCMENSVPIVVFSLYNKGDLAKIVSGEDVGTIVTH
ncbi:hypothetical protein RsTz2092_03080 [Deferribacterales bacterium RsTz2092]|nr:hypothetical protein AGMMS49941_07860 [Deferribacterales bacterium]